MHVCMYVCKCAFKHFDLNLYFHYENLGAFGLFVAAGYIFFFYYFRFNVSFIIAIVTH